MYEKQQVVHFLVSMVARWPRENEVPDPELTKYLSKGFDRHDLRVPVPGVSRVEKFRCCGHEQYEIIFLDNQAYLQRGLVIVENGQLKLDALEFKCPACFGEGVLDGRPCILCEGRGWGAGRS